MLESKSCSCCGNVSPFYVVLRLGKEHIIVCEDCLRDMLEVTITNRRNLERKIEDHGESLSSMLRESGIDITEDELSELFDFKSSNKGDDYEDDNKSKDSEGITLKTPSEIKALLDQRVIGQDKAKRVVSVAIYNHYKRILSGRTDIQKSNIMMVGSTGAGKTEIARTVAGILDVPFVIADATSLTQAGYVGADVETIVSKLLSVCDYDVSKVERGIIYIDEIDKIARKSNGVSESKDVNGEGVQQALLKIIEGNKIEVPVGGDRRNPHTKMVTVDTSNILFILGGAFEGLTMAKPEKKKALGFVTGNQVEEDDKFKTEIKIDAKSLTKQGMIPELVGRVPVIVKLDDLTKDDLKRILVEPTNSIVNQYKSLLSLDEVELVVEDTVLDFIATKAYENGTGARGLKSVLESSMTDLMFEIPDRKDTHTVNLGVSEDTITYEFA